MIRAEYKQQVKLLLSILPEIAKVDCFALHGGTAINLFVRNMPRLSVDIDLTYLPIEDFETSRKNINAGLQQIIGNIQKVIKDIKINHNQESCKLNISGENATIKVEVSLMGRGSLIEPIIMTLCETAQEAFDVSVKMKILPLGLLFGSKICAALDRQHPRDLFDVNYLLKTEGITDEVKEGFLFYLASHSRPLNEMISPNWQNQTKSLESQFEGMTDEEFSYKDYEQTRENLLKLLHEKLTEYDRKFILGIKKVDPDWSLYKFEAYPGIRWKLQNIQKLKEQNPEKYRRMLEKLESVLFPN